MRKIFTLTAALCGLLILTGCTKFYEEFLSDQFGETVTFTSLTGNEDLTVERKLNDDGKLSISTSKYNGDFLAVAVYETNCDVCKLQAPWLDKLAQEFRPKGMDFVIVFLDVSEISPNPHTEWAQNLANVDAYMNAATSCTDGVCKKVFAPHFAGLLPGAVYFVDKKDIEKTERSVVWSTARDPRESCGTMRAQIAGLLGESVLLEDWEDEYAEISF